MNDDLRTLITVAAFLGSIVATIVNYLIARRAGMDNRRKSRHDFFVEVRSKLNDLYVKYRELLVEGTSDTKFDFQGWHTLLVSEFKVIAISTGDYELTRLAQNELTEYTAKLADATLDQNNVSYIQQNIKAMDKINIRVGELILKLSE